MPCFNPLFGFVSDSPNENGKFPVTWKISEARRGDNKLALPCGKCLGCRMDRARQWAVRCVHEASLYDENCFITLTYDDDNLPVGSNLCPGDFTKFMKRLREKFRPLKIRYFQCGEYGEINGRPHHHACLFGFDFPDKKMVECVSGKCRTFTSDVLNELWGFGFCLIGDVTPESAAYVARYVLKKQESSTDKEVKPYVTMSRGRRPDGGIGYKWFTQFADTDVYPKDYLTLNGVKYKPPKYYDQNNALLNPKTMVEIKHKRIALAKSDPDNSYRQMRIRENLLTDRVAKMERL